MNLAQRTSKNAVPIAHIGGGDFHLPDQSQGIYQQVTFASFDLFAGVITDCFSLGCRLNGLAIET